MLTLFNFSREYLSYQESRDYILDLSPEEKGLNHENVNLFTITTQGKAGYLLPGQP